MTWLFPPDAAVNCYSSALLSCTGLYILLTSYCYLLLLLQGLQSDARSNNLSSDAALQELSDAMTDLAAQLQASLQHRVFGGMSITVPTLPTAAKPSVPQGASGFTGSRGKLTEVLEVLL